MLVAVSDDDEVADRLGDDVELSETEEVGVADRVLVAVRVVDAVEVRVGVAEADDVDVVVLDAVGV